MADQNIPNPDEEGAMWAPHQPMHGTDEQFYQATLGNVSYQKVLTPKSKTFDALTRGNTEGQDIPTVVCELFRPGLGQNSIYSDPQFVRDVFHKETVLQSEDQMFSSTVVGWTSETDRTLLVNPINLGNLQKDIVPMTDTLFPVMVTGREHRPVTPQLLDRDIMGYEAGAYLILSDYPGLGSVTIQISVQKQNVSNDFNVNTYRAELELFLVSLRWKPEEQIYYKDYTKFGKIDRILDKDNTAYGVFGMYAGGPLPPMKSYASNKTKKHRICWDQPKDHSSSDYGLNAMEGSFRWDTDYQRGSRRVGYYCSRDSLCAVRETKVLEMGSQGTARSADFNSLLKEYTFVIVDGFSSYVHFYGESDTKNTPFKDLDDSTLGPVIVIIPEGVSSLEVHQNTEFGNYRNSVFCNENPAQPPIVLNWKTFQNDFNLEANKTFSKYWEPNVKSKPFVPQAQLTPAPQPPTGVETGFQQIMRLNEFQDYVVFPIRSMKREYVFALKQAPNYFPDQRRYDEYWHVYARLSSLAVATQSTLYYYLGTISNSYYPRNGNLEYSKTHFQHSVFPKAINTVKYPSINQQDEERAEQMATEWRTVTKNDEFKEILRKLVTLDVNQLNNVTINGHSRQKRIDWLRAQD